MTEIEARITARPWEAVAGEAKGIWLVEIDNPSKLNAMTRAMWQQLREVFVALQNNPQVRCIVVQGAAQAFCAGGDISEYPQFRFDPASLAHFHEQEVWGGLSAILACDVPVIAAIQGACMGAGVEIACCCDVRWVAEGAKFGAPIAKLGFPMAPKEAQLVMHSVGRHAAQRMLLEAAVFQARDMAAFGWCAVAPDVEVWRQEVQRTALRIASLAPQAARLNKQTWRVMGQGLPVMDAYAYANSAEHREGIAAFIDKRTPNF